MKTKANVRWWIWIVGLLPFWCLAKPFTLDEKITPLRLDLQASESRKGSKGALVQGVTIADGHHFYVKGHGMFQPIDVILESPENTSLTLDVFTSTWQSPERTAATASTGLAALKFMAYGEFGLRVTGDRPGEPYLLTVYAASEKLPEFANPFVPLGEGTDRSGEGAGASSDASMDAGTATKPGSNGIAVTTANPTTSSSGTAGASNGENAGHSSADASHGDASDGSLLVYVIIALLVVIIILLAALLLRRGKSTPLAAVLLPLLLWQPDPAFAEAASSNPGYGPDHIRLPGTFEQPPPPEGWSGMSSEDADKQWERGAKTLEYLKKLQEAASAWEAYDSLDSCMRISNPPSMPEVPSFCSEPVVAVEADGMMEYIMRPNRNCATCFTQARLAFNKARLDLEKLRVIYNCTKKMSNAAIAAGDSMSGIHGYSGIIWQGLRYDITQSVDKLEQAYDAKYPELIGKLHAALIEMSACEASFGTEDWYDRFGFIYYEFMKDSYKRKD